MTESIQGQRLKRVPAIDNVSSSSSGSSPDEESSAPRKRLRSQSQNIPDGKAVVHNELSSADRDINVSKKCKKASGTRSEQMRESHMLSFLDDRFKDQRFKAKRSRWAHEHAIYVKSAKRRLEGEGYDIEPYSYEEFTRIRY